MESNQSLNLDVGKVKTAVKSGLPVTVSTYFITHDVQNYIDNVLKAFLSEVDYLFCAESLCYCVKELSDNACKANIKRVYFEEQHLDINDKAGYKRGIKNFNQAVSDNKEHYLLWQKQKGLYIKVIIQIKDNTIILQVKNNVQLTIWEYKRIHDRLSRSVQYQTIEQGMNDIIDASEGAGLGLVIMVLTLRKLGLTEESYTIDSVGNETTAQVSIPFNAIMTENLHQMCKEYVDIVEGLPMFPENISRINGMIKSNHCDIQDIAKEISSDVGLTGELIRMVNTAAFGLSSSCSSVLEAVKLIGLKGVQNLLYSIGTMQIFNTSKDEEKRKLWIHSYKVAFFCSVLSKKYFHDDKYKDLRDNCYVAALLHDMGKLIFETAHPSSVLKIQKICKEHNVSHNLFENLVAGANHSEIGGLVAEKWNFPQVLTDVIKNHHNWNKALPQNRLLASLVYLSDCLVHYMEGDLEYTQIEANILKFYKINTQSLFTALGSEINSQFRSAGN